MHKPRALRRDSADVDHWIAPELNFLQCLGDVHLWMGHSLPDRMQCDLCTRMHPKKKGDEMLSPYGNGDKQSGAEGL